MVGNYIIGSLNSTHWHRSIVHVNVQTLTEIEQSRRLKKEMGLVGLEGLSMNVYLIASLTLCKCRR